MILVAVNSVPIWEKANLNLEEAAAYFGIGINKLRDMTNENNCPFVLWNGNKRLIKRRAFERFLDSSYSIYKYVESACGVWYTNTNPTCAFRWKGVIEIV